MTRPAQPGDLAFLVAQQEENDGIIVRVGPPHKGYLQTDVGLLLCSPGTFYFIVTSVGRPITLYSMDNPQETITTHKLPWPRDRLIPILDEPGEDETLTWKSLPTTLLPDHTT